MANIEKLEQDLKDQVSIQEEAAKKAEEIRDTLDTERVKTFDKKLVERAKELGINPRNYADELLLKEAIHIVNPSEGKEEE